MRYLLFAALIFTACACHNPKKEKIEKLLEFVKVEGGTFTMGDNLLGKENGDQNHYTEHEVELSDFYMQKTEVTQELWEAVMGSNPSRDNASKGFSVTHVSWYECQQFIEELNTITGKKYRLPTEAEWEFAARGGKLSKGYRYAGSDEINEVAWHAGNSDSKVHSVAEKKPNELGLYDMSGNVWEWCADWYGEYTLKAKKDPVGPDNRDCKVIRGGGWYCKVEYCHVAYRDFWFPGFKSSSGGLRLCSPVE
jgi:formylglycine-generating enzyme required for sulfatase activity